MTLRPWKRAAIGVAVFIAGWLVFWSWDYEYGRTTKLSDRYRLHEQFRAERSAFSLAGHAVPVIAIPIPSRSELPLQQTILEGDRVIWRGVHWDAPSGLGGAMDARAYDSVYAMRGRARMFVSPDERYIGMEAEAHGGPFRVLDVSTSRVREIPSPDTALHVSSVAYPLRFHGWSADSRRLYLRTHEGGDSRDSTDRNVREIWAIDPESGVGVQAARCIGTVVWYEHKGTYDWSRTPCANSARP